MALGWYVAPCRCQGGEVWYIGWDRSSHRHGGKNGVNSSLHKHIGPDHRKGPVKRLTKDERRLARRIDRQWRNRKAYKDGRWKT